MTYPFTTPPDFVCGQLPALPQSDILLSSSVFSIAALNLVLTSVVARIL